MAATPPSGRKLSRRERELQFRIGNVVEAALEVFSERSFASVSIDDIARRAELSVGTLYKLFASKEDIYAAVVSRAQRGFFEHMENCMDDARGCRDQLVAAVRGALEYFAIHGRAFRIYNSRAEGFSSEVRDRLFTEARAHQEALMSRITELCQLGIDQGVFKPGVPADMLARVILGLPHSYVVYWLENQGTDLLDHVPSAVETVERMLGTD
ncbi:MAG: TetR/AcrR family transcriptional regulator [Candidatus Binatia bacterium]